MPPGENTEMLRETYRLAKENNKMLHSMRRSAIWGGIIKFILYAALLLIPAYLYLQYLSPIVDKALKVMNQAQGTGAQAELQIKNLQDSLKQITSKIPGMSSSSSGN
jgi:hypothetical protein